MAISEKGWRQRATEAVIEMFQDSVIIQGAMALTVIVVIAVMVLRGQAADIPEAFWGITGAIIGFYFKAKNDNQVRKLVREADTAVAMARERDDG